MADAPSNKIMTPEFRVAFARVFTPDENENGDKKFSLVAMFSPGTDLTVLRKAAAAVARAKWGDKIPEGLRSPFKDSGKKTNSEGELYDGFVEGGIHMTFSTKFQPGIVDAQRVDIIDESDFYSGCFARATVNAYAYKHPKSGPGVAFGLNNLQKTRDGDPFGTRTNPADDFDSLPQGDHVTSNSAAPAASENDDLFA
jgi:hypothetical protein